MNKLPGASCCSVHAGSDEECEQKEHKCTHESDSVEHIMTDEGGTFSMFRCKKCGEFYK